MDTPNHPEQTIAYVYDTGDGSLFLSIRHPAQETMPTSSDVLNALQADSRATLAYRWFTLGGTSQLRMWPDVTPLLWPPSIWGIQPTPYR